MLILTSPPLSKLNPRRSLKALLFWNTAGMVLILALLLSLLVGYVSGTRIESTRGQSLEQLAAQMADKLESGMFERYKDIQVLSTLNSIRQPTDSISATRTFPLRGYRGVNLLKLLTNNERYHLPLFDLLQTSSLTPQKLAYALNRKELNKFSLST